MKILFLLIRFSNNIIVCLDGVNLSFKEWSCQTVLAASDSYTLRDPGYSFQPGFPPKAWQKIIMGLTPSSHTGIIFSSSEGQCNQRVGPSGLWPFLQEHHWPQTSRGHQGSRSRHQNILTCLMEGELTGGAMDGEARLGDERVRTGIFYLFVW